MAVNRATLSQEYIPGLFALIIDTYDAGKQDSVYEQICSVKKSTKQSEKLAMRSSLGHLAIKEEGGPVHFDEPIQGPTLEIVHRTRGLAVRLTEEAIDDNLYELGRTDWAQDMAKDLGASAARTPDVLLGLAFDNAANTTYYSTPDNGGTAWASATHYRIDGSTYSNLATHASPTWSAVWSAVENAENQFDHRQKRVRMEIEALIYPPQMEKYFREIFESPDRPDTANRAKNILKSRNPKQIILRDWTDTDAWCLKVKGFSKGGLTWFQRWPTRFAKEGDFETGDMKMKVIRRDSMGMADPRQFYWVIPN